MPPVVSVNEFRYYKANSFRLYVRSKLAVYFLIQLFIRSLRVEDSHFADYGVIFLCIYWLLCVFLFSLWLTTCLIWMQINEVSCCMHVSVNANDWIDPKHSPISSDRLCLKEAAYSIHTVAHACTAIPRNNNTAKSNFPWWKWNNIWLTEAFIFGKLPKVLYAFIVSIQALKRFESVFM